MRRWHGALLATLAMFVIADHALAQPAPMRLVRFTSPDTGKVLADLGDLGVDTSPCTTHAGKGWVEAVLSLEEQIVMRDRGHPFEVLSVGRPLREILAEKGEVPEGYLDLEGIEGYLWSIAREHPEIVQLVDLTLEFGTPETADGNHIFALKISDNPTRDEIEPAVLVVAGHHAREINTPVVALHVIDQLVSQYDRDARTTSAVNDFEIWVIPIQNPDGYQYVFDTDNWWRKNRSNNGGGEWGTDLNRNYPPGWGTCGGADDPASDTYVGASVGSEPETQTMLAFAEDRRFTRVADLHSFAREVRHGYGCWDHPWDSAQRSIAARIANSIGYDPAYSCCLGGNIHAHTQNYGALAFLWEIGDDFQPLYDDARSEAELLWPAILSFITRDTPISGRVTDRRTGGSVEATIEILDADFEHDEQHLSHPGTGLYHVHASNGKHQLRFSASRYQAQTYTVSINTQQNLSLDVELTAKCDADLTDNGSVNTSDFFAFLTYYTRQDTRADLNHDALVNSADFFTFLMFYQQGC